jgi:hypothetical protein
MVRPPRRPAWYGPLWHPTAVRNGNKLVDLPGLRGAGMRPIARTPVTAFGRVVQGIPLTGGQASTTISAGPGSGPAIVQGPISLPGVQSGSLPNPTKAGNCVVVIITGFNTTSGKVPSVSGVTLGGAADHFEAGTTAVTGFIDAAYMLASTWVDYNCAGGQTAIAVSGTNLSVNASTGIILYEVSGVIQTNPVDQTATGVQTGSAGNIAAGPTPTTSAPNEAWFVAVATAATVAQGGAPWTMTALNTVGCGGGYQLVSSTGTASYTGGSGTGVSWAAAIVTLKGVAPSFALPSGQGIVSVGPQGLGNVWYPAQATISTTSGVNDNSLFSLYLGPAGVPVTLVGQAFPGGTGTLAVAVPSMTPGQYLIGVWTGGNPGDLASINVIGTMDCLAVLCVYCAYGSEDYLRAAS